VTSILELATDSHVNMSLPTSIASCLEVLRLIRSEVEFLSQFSAS
jgi:hypothetical protein